MVLIQYFIIIMAPIVLFQDSHIMLGVVAVINLFVYTWSFKKFLKTTGAPPGSWGPGCEPSTVSGDVIGNKQSCGQDVRFLSTLTVVNQLTLALAYGLLAYVAIQSMNV